MNSTTSQDNCKSYNNGQHPLIALYLLGVLVLFALSYFAIFLPYGFHDDYRYLGNLTDRSSFCKLHTDILENGVSMGRPIASLAIGLQSLVTTTIESLKWQRMVLFLVIIGFSFSLYRFLHYHLKWHHYWAMTTALIFCCLPQCALLVQWCILSVFASLSLFTTFLSHRFYRISMVRFQDKNTSRWLRLTYFFLSMLLLQLSFYNYPVMGLFFCVFTYAYLLFSPEESRNRVYVNCIKEVIFLTGSMLLFFISYKFIYQKLLFIIFPSLKVVYEHLLYHRIEISLNWRSFLMPLVNGAFTATTGPFHPVFGNNTAFISIFLTVVMLFFCFIGSRTNTLTHKNSNINGFYLLNSRRIIEALLGFCILYPLSISPVMLSSWEQTYYRTALGASCLFLLFFMFLLKGVLDHFVSPQRIKSTYSYTLIFLFFINATFYHFTITNYAVSATREQQYISQKVAEEIDEKSLNSPLVFMVKGYDLSKKGSPLFGLFRPSWDFGLTMFCPPHAHMYEFIEYIARMRGYRGDTSILFKNEGINLSDQKEIVPTNLQCKIIDLKYISSLYNNNMYNSAIDQESRVIANVSTEGLVIKLTVENENLVARFPENDFWETTDDFPHTFEIDFGENVQLSSYSLQRSLDPMGPVSMPCSWKVYASKNGAEFTLIDERDKVKEWNSINFVPFRLNEIVLCRKLRFRFDKSSAMDIFRIRALQLHFFNRKPIKSITYSSVPVLTQAMYNGKNVIIDFPIDLFWETSAPPPRIMDIELNSQMSLTGYDLQRSEFKEGPDRMPKLWKVYGSKDGENYLLLDEQRNESWNKLDFVPFELANKAKIKFMRFVFGPSKADIFRIRALRFRFN